MRASLKYLSAKQKIVCHLKDGLVSSTSTLTKYEDVTEFPSVKTLRESRINKKKMDDRTNLTEYTIRYGSFYYEIPQSPTTDV